ncbi:GntR family transcriptional regulator [Actinokineospora globicatena]|uniref:Transcriptional regulator n=1 Tax=Actinokineospora globicatena TaxID=103729 RepID=A0A9W6QN14_9PSEU|nr:GntR family transcriptional regulator [Actinokineospora globicatena]MCP2302715.1 GntR family transcriptional regulator [Actinokineospora globicatena]GLW75596.1 transcriptional regulator [Actinokineospora globicatena]GLW82436.1 transcriptional regulator [Actinokineospora globicatena]GLW91378.1 transcriptional regulator [Actinokineospora globicatena]
MAPKYVSIQDDLVRRIAAAEFRAGRPLPPQRELSEEYGVSLMTLRQALRALEDEGVVEQVAGKGTFVRAHRVPYLAAGLGSIVDDLAAQGIVMTTVQLRAEVVTPTPDIAERLRADRVLEVERLRLVGAQPVVHQLSRIPAALGSALLDADFRTTSLYHLLTERCGRVPARATETLTPVAVTADLAHLLAVPRGTLCLRSTRLTLERDATPLVADEATLVSARMEVRIERHTTTQQLRYHVGASTQD